VEAVAVKVCKGVTRQEMGQWCKGMACKVKEKQAAVKEEEVKEAGAKGVGRRSGRQAVAAWQW